MSKLSAQNPYDEYGNPRPPLYYDYDGNYYYERPEGFDGGKVWAVLYAFAAFISISGGGFIGMIAFALLAYDAFTDQGNDEDDDPVPQYLPPATQPQHDLPTPHYPPIAASLFGQFQPQQQFQPHPQQQSEPVAYAQSNQPIGPQTRLGAIEVPASTPAPPSEQRPSFAIPSFTVHPPRGLYDVANDLGGNRAENRLPQNCLIVGTPGAGKGIVVSNAVRAVRQQYPELTIIGVDPKAQPSEDGLWEVSERCYSRVFRRPIINMNPESIAEWVAEVIEVFRQFANQGPSVLVFDELNAVKASLDQLSKDSYVKDVPRLLNAFLTHLISLGDGSGKWFWGIAQSATDKSLPFDTSVRNNLRTVAIVSMDNVGAVQGLLRTDIIPTNQKDLGAVERCIKNSPIGRAFYDRKTNQWHPMPKLKNYGMDRNPFAASPTTAPPTISPVEQLERAYTSPSPVANQPTTPPIGGNEKLKEAAQKYMDTVREANGEWIKTRDACRKVSRGMRDKFASFHVWLERNKGDEFEVRANQHTNGTDSFEIRWIPPSDEEIDFDSLGL